MGGLTTRPVDRLGVSINSLDTWTLADVDYDYAIGGVPLLANTGAENPYGRKTAPYRKDQIDQSTEPGEQSLVFWWLRSQVSFHGGAGIKYEEPDPNVPILQNRFEYSQGLDVFTTKGQATLLPVADNNRLWGNPSNPSSVRPYVMACTDANGKELVIVAGSNLDGGKSNLHGIILNPTADVVYRGFAWEAGGHTDANVRAMTNDGTNYYVANAVGIYQGPLTSLSSGVKIWNTGSSNVALSWCKQRLMAGIANKVYELTGVSGGPTLPADGTTGHIYSHPNTGWVWTAFEETPTAILASGYAGAQSVVYKMQLGAGDGSVPTVGDPVIVAKLPPGEIVYSLKNILDTYVAIGTSRGVRIATIDGNGNLQYGPLTVESSTPIYQFAIRDRFLYFTWTGGLENGDSCLGCIDLSTQTDFGRWAYSTHLAVDPAFADTATTATCYGVVVTSDDRLAFITDPLDGSGSTPWLESTTQTVASGYLRTGKIRFHTLEPKLFKFCKVRATSLVGSITASFTDATDDSATLATWNTAGDTSLDEVVFPTSEPTEWAALTFTLTSNTAQTGGPTWLGYQVKALPAQKNQRLIFVPVNLFDYESDRNGGRVGYEGYAWNRLKALETMEEARDIVLFQDLTAFAPDARQVVIDDITFQQQAPPTDFSGFGGTAQITLRTVT